MNDDPQHQPTLRAEKHVLAAPNPQGKGQVGFLRDWEDSSPRLVVAKPPAQVLADYFTSLLVLSAEFKFKPVFGAEYFLYRNERGWSLSLLSPDDWGTAEKRDTFVGACVLHDDATWSIAPSANLARPGLVADAIADFYDAFVNELDSERALETELPFYAAKLPYYQRLFAAALSRSLTLSVTYAGQRAIASRDWLKQLPGTATRLLGAERQ